MQLNSALHLTHPTAERPREGRDGVDGEIRQMSLAREFREDSVPYDDSSEGDSDNNSHISNSSIDPAQVISQNYRNDNVLIRAPKKPSQKVIMEETSSSQSDSNSDDSYIEEPSEEEEYVPARPTKSTKKIIATKTTKRAAAEARTSTSVQTRAANRAKR